MHDETPLRIAIDKAWSIFLATRSDVDAADQRRSTLERHLKEKWLAGQNDPEELTCFGLSYLARLGPEYW
jgi:hypothetical protein